MNESPEAITFSWEVSTTPVTVSDITIGGVATKFKPTAHLEIDSTKVPQAKLTQLEDILYGTDAGSGTTATDPRLPLPNEVATIVGFAA